MILYTLCNSSSQSKDMFECGLAGGRCMGKKWHKVYLKYVLLITQEFSHQDRTLDLSDGRTETRQTANEATI